MTKMTASDFLREGQKILDQRGKEYVPQDSNNKPKHEDSFESVASAFNAITRRNLSGSDVALILNLLKKVRQYTNPTRLHFDSLQDSVNYDALWASNLMEELSHVNQESTTDHQPV